jgi:hypothetical protein
MRIRHWTEPLGAMGFRAVVYLDPWEAAALAALGRRPARPVTTSDPDASRELTTTYYEIGDLGHHGLMRVRAAPEFLELAYFDGSDWVVEGDLLRYYGGEDQGDAVEIDVERAWAMRAAIERRRMSH